MLLEIRRKTHATARPRLYLGIVDFTLQLVLHDVKALVLQYCPTSTSIVKAEARDQNQRTAMLQIIRMLP